jgi:hypothetical protein
MVENNRLIPDHQFGFRQRHLTIEQTHRILQRGHETVEVFWTSLSLYPIRVAGQHLCKDSPVATKNIWRRRFPYSPSRIKEK